VLGNGITGTSANTVYVPNFNIKTLGIGTSVNNLGIDVDGNVVTGVSDDLNADLYVLFESAETFEFFAPFDMKITAVEKNNSATIIIEVNDFSYTLDTTITKFDKITVSSDAASKVVVKGEKI
jgi:hypothetical protein